MHFDPRLKPLLYKDTSYNELLIRTLFGASWQACHTSRMIAGWYGSSHPNHPRKSPRPPGHVQDLKEHLQDVQELIQDLSKEGLLGFGVVQVRSKDPPLEKILLSNGSFD